MRKFTKTMVTATLAATMALSVSTTASAKTIDFSKVHNTYVKEAEKIALAQTFGPQASTYSSGSMSSVLPWYENTGTSIPEGHTPDYASNKILEVAQPGDIIFESKGGYGVTGHTCIVEGKFFDERTQTWYVRMIESTLPGTIRGIFDGTLVGDTGAKLYRVKDATEEQKQKAVEFCIGQLGTTYNLDFAHDSSADENDWYCSELVWAAYYNQGIDIETKGMLNEPGITPRDISRSAAVMEIDFK